MHRIILVGIAIAASAAVGAASPAGAQALVNVSVESTVLVLEESRVARLGLSGLEIAGEAGAVRAGAPVGTVRAGTRIGGLSVSAFVDVVRRERAVRSEATQRVLTLSGSAAEVSSPETLVGVYGQRASAGPALWVEPTALEDGRVRLRVWTATGVVRQGAWGTAWEDVAVDARTEIVVPAGTPVVIAETECTESATGRGILSRGSAEGTSRTLVVVRASVRR